MITDWNKSYNCKYYALEQLCQCYSIEDPIFHLGKDVLYSRRN